MTTAMMIKLAVATVVCMILIGLAFGKDKDGED
jgi:hypothetical protein